MVPFKLFWLSLLIVLLCACATTPDPTTHYYLLNKQAASIDNGVDGRYTKQIHKTPHILLAPIQLPDYLNQPSLVMQLNHHQLHYAQYHRWAESLQDAMTQSLLLDLNNSADNISFSEQKHSNSHIQTLILQIDHFYPNAQSQVILSGRYNLLDVNGNLAQPQKSFSFNLDLNENGYNHSVAKMRELISLLSQVLYNQIKQSNT